MKSSSKENHKGTALLPYRQNKNSKGFICLNPALKDACSLVIRARPRAPPRAPPRAAPIESISQLSGFLGFALLVRFLDDGEFRVGVGDGQPDVRRVPRAVQHQGPLPDEAALRLLGVEAHLQTRRNRTQGLEHRGTRQHATYKPETLRGLFQNGFRCSLATVE